MSFTDAKSHSVKSLYHEMLLAVKSDGNNHNWLIRKCNRQSVLLGVQRKSLGIIPMTLNTFKKYADKYINGGFKEVERVRSIIKKKYLDKKSNQAKKIEENKINYKIKLDEAERARAILIRAYNDLNKICLDAISRSPEYQYDYKRHLKLYGTYFSLELATINA